MSFTFYTLKQRPEFGEQLVTLGESSFPKFLINNNKSSQYSSVYEEIMLKFCIVVCNDEERVVGGSYTIPIEWNKSVSTLPNGYDGAIYKAIQDIEENNCPDTLCALSVIVSKKYRGEGLSNNILNAMKEMAKQNNFNSLIIPVRPTLKKLYPLIAIEDYIDWKCDNGQPFDPWLRTHYEMGAKVLSIARNSMNIIGSVSDWEEWTGMRFLQSGEYVIPEALVPITISLEENKGEYKEPNIWVEYSI